MKNIFFVIIFFCLSISPLLITYPVKAIAPPDSMTIDHCKALQNIFVLGDVIFIVRYNIEYTTNPTDPGSTAFLINLRNSSGAIVGLAGGVPIMDDGYGNDFIAMYLTPAQASLITWSGTYSIRLMGNPSLFPVYPYYDYSLTSTDWISSATLATGQSYFATEIINQTRARDLLETTTMVSFVFDGYRLNNAGTAYWNQIVPGISTIPGITAINSENVVYDNATYTYPTKTASDAALTVTMKNNIKVLTDSVGIPWYTFGIILLILVWISIAGVVYQVSGGNTKLSAVMAMPAAFVVAFLFSSVLVWVVFAVFMTVAIVLFTRFM